MTRDEFLDKLPKSMRIDAANLHREAAFMAAQITKYPVTDKELDACYMDFLSGWDAAMEVRFPELIEENHDLHARLFDIEAKKAGEIEP